VPSLNDFKERRRRRRGANYKNVMHDDVILVDVADVGDQNIEC
jgi:hypothetical protein